MTLYGDRVRIVLSATIGCYERYGRNGGGEGDALFVGSRFSRERPTPAGHGGNGGTASGRGEDQLWRARTLRTVNKLP